MDVQFDLKGFDQLKRQLRRMDSRTSTKFAKMATRKASKILLDDMKQRVPKRTGNLRRSLGLVNVRRSTPGAWLKVGARSGKRLKYDGWYAHLVEFPTRAHSIKRKSGANIDHPGTKRQPFMRPAVDAKGKKVINHIGRELGALIEKFY